MESGLNAPLPPRDPKMDELTWDLERLGLRKTLEAAVGEQVVRSAWTCTILFAAFVVGLFGRRLARWAVNKSKRKQFLYGCRVFGTLVFIGCSFVLIGYGIGYTTGYGDRIATEQINEKKSATNSVMMRIFWSFLLSCTVTFLFSFTTVMTPCCGDSYGQESFAAEDAGDR